MRAERSFMKKAGIATALVVLGIAVLGVSVHAAAGAEGHAAGACIVCNTLCSLVGLCVR
jgi:hypothetical protein